MRKRTEPADAGRHDTEGEQGRLAVLIDADNAHAGIVEALLAEIARFGVASVKRIYGDWTQPQLGSWKKILLQHSIVPVQQFGYTKGKNATDSALIIDAMDLLYTRRFDGFCLVSSDSDFTRLASRLREEGLLVYGFGERKTPGPFVSACDKFIYTELLRPGKPHAPLGTQATTGPAAPNGPAPVLAPGAATALALDGSGSTAGNASTRRSKSRSRGVARDRIEAGIPEDAAASVGHPALTGFPDSGDPEGPGLPQLAASVPGEVDGLPAEGDSLPAENVDAPVELIAHAIDTVSDDTGWASLGAVGRTLTKLRPDFDSRLYGYRKFSELIRALPERFDTEERTTGSGKTIFVRLIPRPSKKTAAKRSRAAAGAQKRTAPKRGKSIEA